MRAQFQQRQALTEQTVIDRKVLADNNIIRINKETRQKIKGAEKEWQGRTAKWVATAKRKVGESRLYGEEGSNCPPKRLQAIFSQAGFSRFVFSRNQFLDNVYIESSPSRGEPT